jgi:hypothetical protein
MRHPTLRLACALCLLCGGAVADEVRLKDGGKLHGTVVGYEGNSFKLQTSYGYALVRKDKIAAIIPSEVTTAPRTAAKPKAQEPKKPAPPGKGAEQPPPAPLVSVEAKKEGMTATADASPVSPSGVKADAAMTPAPLAGIFEHHFTQDFSASVGTKIWIHDWETTQPVPVELGRDRAPLPDSHGFIAASTSEGVDVTPIPVVSLRYKNLFVTGSHYVGTDFEFPEMTIAEPTRFPTATTQKTWASRLEWDASIGYFLHPYVAVTAGYKFIEQEFLTTGRTGSSLGPPGIEPRIGPPRDRPVFAGTFSNESETEISGPFVGLVTSAPIGRGFGIYGLFAYGFLESNFEQVRDRFTSLKGDVTEEGALDRGDEESQPYILLEGGFSYTHAMDHLPAYLPLSLATVYAGYRYQDFDTDTGTFGNFNDNEARDVTRGFAVGVNLTY